MNPLSHIPLSIIYFYSHLDLSLFRCCLLLQALLFSLHLHLHVSSHSMCIVSLVLDIRLNTLTFKFFTTSGTHIFAYGSLILLQLQLHLLVLILKRWKTGSLLLTLTISGLTLHIWLVIEIHLSGVAANKFTLDKIVNPVKSIFFYKPNHFYIILFFFIKYLWLSKILSTAISS